MKMQVETFAKSSDAPAQTSPELVLVSPPEEAQAAREALTEPQPETATVASQAPRSVALRQVVAPEERLVVVPPPKARPASFAPPPSPPPAPAAPARRRRSRMLLLAFALALAAGGFVVGRQLGERHRPAAVAAIPATAQSVSHPAATTGRAQSAGARTRSTSSVAGPQSTSPPRAAPAPAVSWKARPGVRHYRLDVVRGGAVVLTILTDEPRASIPLTFPNAGRRSRLAPGTYQWRVSAATARPSRVLSHGTVRVH
jgi:hypothetical protein